MSEHGAKAQRCSVVHEVAALIRFVRSTVIAAFGLLAAGAATLGSQPVLAQSPPPPPVPASGAPTAIPVIAAPTDAPAAAPSASAQPSGRHRRGRSSTTTAPGASPVPTPTPTVPGFATLDGTWEVQLQHPDSTDYSYLDIKQAGQSLSGAWRVKKQTFPFTAADCTYDGKLVRIVAKTATGTATFSGYVENGSDMVGTLDMGDKNDPTPFTAGHRGKDKGLFGGAGLSPAGVPLPGAGGTGAGNFPH